MGLEPGGIDFLGDRFQQLEMANHWRGQFFTPMNLCKLMAGLTLDENADRIIAERGYITVHEPACGAGAMVLALAEAMLARGFNPQTQLHVYATDIDRTAAHMAFVQFSAVGLPAIVEIGDTLAPTYGQGEKLLTPFHHLGLWGYRGLQGAFARPDPHQPPSEPPAPQGTPFPAAPDPAPSTPVVPRRQLALF